MIFYQYTPAFGKEWLLLRSEEAKKVGTQHFGGRGPLLGDEVEVDSSRKVRSKCDVDDVEDVSD